MKLINPLVSQHVVSTNNNNGGCNWDGCVGQDDLTVMTANEDGIIRFFTIEDDRIIFKSNYKAID